MGEQQRISEIRERWNDTLSNPGNGVLYTAFIAPCIDDVPWLLAKLADTEADLAAARSERDAGAERIVELETHLVSVHGCSAAVAEGTGRDDAE